MFNLTTLSLTPSHPHTLTPSHPHTLTVNTDYGNFSALVIFQPSPELVQQQCFNISITDDAIFEQDESFSVAIAATNLAVSLHISRATVTIGDDDHVTVGLQGSEFTANEGSGTLDICCDLIGQLERSVSISLETMPQTALGKCVSNFIFLVSKFALFNVCTLV